MISTVNNNYYQLELNSSNLIMRADSRITIGKYEEAAYCFRTAGAMRNEMGDIQFTLSEWDYAAEDWLSGASCYHRATAHTACSTHGRCWVLADTTRQTRHGDSIG